MKDIDKRFLIALLRFHGDMVLVTPLIKAIKRLNPNAKIDLLVYKGTGQVLSDDYRIDKVFEANLSSQNNFLKRISGEIRLYFQLRSQNYDFGIFMTTQWRMTFFSRVISSAKRTGVGDSKRRGKFWINSFDKIFPEVGNKHIVERNLSSLESLGFKLIPEDYQLDLKISKDSEEAIKKTLEQSNIGPEYCVFHPFSRREAKLWNVDRFAALADYYSNKGLKVVLTSGPEQEEVDYLDKIEKECSESVLNLGGRTSLTELAALIKEARFFVGLDSVSSHIAAAVNIPCVTLFGPSISNNWRPWSDKAFIIERKEEKKCQVHSPLGGKFERCLCYIQVERVIESIDEAMLL
ncbi:MAG: putative lipopolysaccharide heptosyltransferase III [Gammaproteobacteria bacterium]